MNRIKIILTFLLLSSTFSFAQNCDCQKNFEWVKKTFEENDAGFEYALKQKGIQTYEDHNKRILEKIQNTKTLAECTPILYEWLKFFRSGHIAIKQNEQSTPTIENKEEQKFPNWDTFSIKTEVFKKYLDKKKSSDYEGIWETEPYTIGIKKEGDKYIGFIIESGAETWTKGQVKLKFSISEDKANSVFYNRSHSGIESDYVSMTGKNHLQIGDFSLTRLYPKIEDEPKYVKYFKLLNENSDAEISL